MSAKPVVLEFGMGVDVHGLDATTAACRAVSDAIRHSSLPLLQEVRERGGRMLVDVMVGVPDPALVYDPSLDTKWSRALARIGVSPDRLQVTGGRA